MSRRQHPEAALQRACVALLSLMPDPAKGGPYWTAINPAPPKGRIQGAIAKSLGARAGVPDILIVWQGRAHFIELKAKAGRLSPAQVQASEEINHAGGSVQVARTLDEFAAILADIGLPVKGSSAA